MEMVLVSSTGLGYIWPKCHSVWHDWHSTWHVSVSAMVTFTLGPRRRSRGKSKKPMDICDSLHASWLYFSPSLSEICYSFRLFFIYSHTICLLCSLSSCLPVHVCFCDVSPQNTCGFCVSQCQLRRCCQTIWQVQMKQQKVVYTEVQGTVGGFTDSGKQWTDWRTDIWLEEWIHIRSSQYIRKCIIVGILQHVKWKYQKHFALQ